MTEHSAEQTEQLLAMAAHDLRAPLRQIGLRWALIERRYRDEMSDAFREDLHAIRGEFQHMQALLEDMLSWVAGHERQAATVVDLGPLFAQLRSLLSQDLNSASAALEIASELPCVFAREASVFRVMLNLIRNALHHCGSGVRVVVSAHQDDRVATIHVRDDGPGIPENLRERIFEPFNRGNAGSSCGSGLGLAICQRLVEEEGGAIGVNAAVSGGSDFWVELPLAPIP